MHLRLTRAVSPLAVLALLVMLSAGPAFAGGVSCAVGGGNVPSGWTLNGVGGGLNASVGAPFQGPSGFNTDCYIVTDTGAGFPGNVTTGFPMASAMGNPGIAGTTNGSQMISPAFNATAGSQLVFDFMFATNDGAGFSDWANVALVPTNGGPPIYLFTARTSSNDQVVPGFGFPSLAPGLVLSPGTASLKGDQWYLNALTGGTSNLDPNATQYGPGRYGGGPGGSSDWNHAVYTFNSTTAGSYQMVMSVANVNDEVYSSALFFTGSSINSNPVATAPEPSTLLLLGSSALGLAGILRRKISW